MKGRKIVCQNPASVGRASFNRENNIHAVANMFWSDASPSRRGSNWLCFQNCSVAPEEPHEQPSTGKPAHKVARSPADAVSTPSFGLEKKEKQRRTGGLWLLSRNLENVSERLLSLEVTWSTLKVQDSCKYSRKLLLLSGVVIAGRDPAWREAFGCWLFSQLYHVVFPHWDNVVSSQAPSAGCEWICVIVFVKRRHTSFLALHQLPFSFWCKINFFQSKDSCIKWAC